MSPDFAFAYYQTLRKAARERISEDLRDPRWNRPHGLWEGMELAAINAEACAHAQREWPRYYGSKTHYGFRESWESLHFQHAARPSHFNLAIWQMIGDTRHLQGMALGLADHGRTKLTLTFIERSFAPTYLRGGILLPVLAVAEEYARLLDCRQLRVKDPVTPSLFARYGFSDYTHARNGSSYLSKDI